MAYKFQTAMPGALLGLEHVISFMLQHFWLLYAGVILFSAAELFAGLFLMLGLFTRISAILSMLFSVLLMLMFGWQGATCIDEWTMAACNLAMGTTLFLCGSNEYALDNVLLKKNRIWRTVRCSAGAVAHFPYRSRREVIKTGIMVVGIRGDIRCGHVQLLPGLGSNALPSWAC